MGTHLVIGADEQAWGRAWHVPTNPPRTQRQVIEDLADAAARTAANGAS